MHLLASSSRTFASNSLHGGYFGKLDGSHGSGFDEKNCKKVTKMCTVKLVWKFDNRYVNLILSSAKVNVVLIIIQVT